MTFFNKKKRFDIWKYFPGSRYDEPVSNILFIFIQRKINKDVFKKKSAI